MKGNTEGKRKKRLVVVQFLPPTNNRFLIGQAPADLVSLEGPLVPSSLVQNSVAQAGFCWGGGGVAKRADAETSPFSRSYDSPFATGPKYRTILVIDANLTGFTVNLERRLGENGYLNSE